MRIAFLTAAWAVGLAACGSFDAFNPGALSDDTGVSDSDTDTDTDADADTDTDTDTTPPGDAPTLDSFAVDLFSPTVIRVLFSASDNDGDLVGGTFELTQDSVVTTYEIPGELAAWDGAEGGVGVSPPPGGGCSQVTTNLSGRVLDAVGHASTSRSDSLTIGGSAATSVNSVEVGDDGTVLYPAGTLGKPATIFGDMYQASNDGISQYTGDLDFIEFTPCAAGSWTFSLSWDAIDGDYDLALYPSTSWEAIDWSETVSEPEVVTATLAAGTTYRIRVGGWSGGAGNYEIAVY